MDIKTKFNIGSNVFFMLENKVMSREVQEIVVKVNYQRITSIEYKLSGVNPIYKEDSLFMSKEDLLSSL